MTTSLFLARAALSASKTTAPGSPPACAMTGTPFRSPHTTSCSRAAARNVSPAARSTPLPCACSHLASLPIEVVLPEPFTPAIITVNGLARDTACLRNDRHAVSLAPHDELLARRGAERVARGEKHALALRSEEHTSELQSRLHLVCRLL